MYDYKHYSTANVLEGGSGTALSSVRRDFGISSVLVPLEDFSVKSDVVEEVVQYNT